MGQEWRRPPRPDPDKSHERHTRAANNTTQATGMKSHNPSHEQPTPS
jgi:hypothetical protein